ncbi:MAG: hypothetical protein II919_03615 [Lachnospiraceae bacterium]|nr:hypothetical protein [Lachnospiraceae bacterium]
MDIEKIVIESCQEVIREKNKDIQVDANTKISRDSGIDSLGIVSLVILLEEKLNIDLDDYLVEIRECEDVQGLIDVISKID